MGLDAVGEQITYGETFSLIGELQKRVDSHLTADLAGWSSVVTWSDLMATLLTETVANALRDPKKDAVRMPRPWDLHEEERAPDVTPDELEALRAQLEARSAFRDR